MFRSFPSWDKLEPLNAFHIVPSRLCHLSPTRANPHLKKIGKLWFFSPLIVISSYFCRKVISHKTSSFVYSRSFGIKFPTVCVCVHVCFRPLPMKREFWAHPLLLVGHWKAFHATCELGKNILEGINWVTADFLKEVLFKDEVLTLSSDLQNLHLHTAPRTWCPYRETMGWE